MNLGVICKRQIVVRAGETASIGRGGSAMVEAHGKVFVYHGGVATIAAGGEGHVFEGGHLTLCANAKGTIYTGSELDAPTGCKIKFHPMGYAEVFAE